MRTESKADQRAQKTCSSTTHFLKVELIIPESVVKDNRSVTLRPTRFTCADGTEFRYSAYLRLRHPPFTGKIPLDVDYEIAQSYHPDGVIDQTTCRLIIVDPVEDREVVDMTHDFENVRMETREEKRGGHLPYRNSRESYTDSPPPLEPVVPLFFFFLVFALTSFSCLHTNTISCLHIQGLPALVPIVISPLPHLPELKQSAPKSLICSPAPSQSSTDDNFEDSNEVHSSTQQHT